MTNGQRNRLVALARAGGSLPWGRSDPALLEKRLVRKYSGSFGEEYADLTGRGVAEAQRILRKG